MGSGSRSLAPMYRNTPRVSGEDHAQPFGGDTDG